jgi:hypothetical protein
VKSIEAKFPSESAVSVCGSQCAFGGSKVACSVAHIRRNFGWLPDSIKHLESQGLSLQESMDVIKNSSGMLSVVKGEAGENVFTNCRKC